MVVDCEAAARYCHPRQNPTPQDGSRRPGGDQAKADLMAAHFSSKMATKEPKRQPLYLIPLCNLPLDNILITEDVVARYLRNVNTRKAPGPDGVRSFPLKHCACELSKPHTHIFQHCVRSRIWFTAWKETRVTPVHKKRASLIQPITAPSRYFLLSANIGAGHC